MTGTSKKTKCAPVPATISGPGGVVVRGLIVARTKSRVTLEVTESPYAEGWGSVGSRVSVGSYMVKVVA